jgi:hypothetical protein
VITHAGEIAEKLQGAHERRTRGEDTEMSRDNEPLSVGESVWDEDPFVHAMKLVERLDKVLNDIATSGFAPGDPQASAVSAERVVELERQLADAKYNVESFREQAESASKAHRDALDRIEGLERSAGMAAAADADQGISELRALLATAYVAREVPWMDVAAGMMTLSREEHPRPWMVAVRLEDGRVELRNGVKTFLKVTGPNETVRVLVPYVTGEQAESLVKDELGGTEVGS